MHEKISGNAARLDSSVQHGLRELWLSGCSLTAWLHAILRAFEQAPRPTRRYYTNVE
jgi:hypothetical protein